MTADFANQNVEVVHVTDRAAFEAEHKSINPQGKLPMLQLYSGEGIVFGAAIAQHLARCGTGLYGANTF